VTKGKNQTGGRAGHCRAAGDKSGHNAPLQDASPQNTQTQNAQPQNTQTQNTQAQNAAPMQAHSAATRPAHLPATAPRDNNNNSGLAHDPRLWQQFRHLVYARFGQNLKLFVAERQLLVWLLALLIGICSALAAIGFRSAVGIFQLPWLGTASERVSEAAARVGWWWVLLAPVAGGLIVGLLLHHFVPGGRAHSIADVIEARAIQDCQIPAKIGIWSAILAAMSLGFGASAGREGPVVHLGATIASFAERRFALSRGARRTLLASGVAAAISASFNAPIAAILFAHEVILAHYALSAFVPITIASVSGALLSRLFLGNFPAFTIPQYFIASYWEFPAFALLGMTCALVAIAFQTSMMVSGRLFMRIDMPLWLRPAVGGFFVGLIALAFPQILGVGYDATDAVLNVEYSLELMLALIVAKTVATSITFAARFAGGIFGPALYLGAMTGGAFGIIVSMAFPEQHSSFGLYGLLGMGAVSASVLGAPISTTMIVFELTRSYEIGIALLLTVSIANGLTQAALGFSYFHWQLSVRGLSLNEGPHKEIMRRLAVRDFLTPLGDGEAVEPVEPGGETPTLMVNDTLEAALRKLDETGRSRIAVVSGVDRASVIGWADRLKALSVYNQALIDSHIEEHH